VSNWIVKSLWRIPALPILAARVSALVHCSGAERRQTVAHGATRGSGVKNITSPGGAKRRFGSSLVCGCELIVESRFLPPLPGLGLICARDPRLAPWATVLRHSMAIR